MHDIDLSVNFPVPDVLEITSLDGSITVTENPGSSWDVAVADPIPTITAANLDLSVGTAPNYSIKIGQQQGAYTTSLIINGEIANPITTGDQWLTQIGFLDPGSSRVLDRQKAVSVGYGALSNQSDVVVGYEAGSEIGVRKVNIGPKAYSRGDDCVSIGYEAGRLDDAKQLVNVGAQSAVQCSGDNGVCVGFQAGINIAGGGFVAPNRVVVGAVAGRNVPGTGNVLLGYRCCQTAGAKVTRNYCVCLGEDCPIPGASGRLAFGNNMEAPIAISTATEQMLSALIPVEWNGTLYRLPALSSTATNFSMGAMPVGELYYANGTGETFAPGVDIAPSTTALLTTANLAAANYFSQSATGRLTYLRTRTQLVHCAFSISGNTAGNNQDYIFTIYKNGVAVAGSDFRVTFPNAGNPFSVAYHKAISFAQNDYITVRYAFLTATNNINFTNFNIVGMGSLMSS